MEFSYIFAALLKEGTQQLHLVDNPLKSAAQLEYCGLKIGDIELHAYEEDKAI